MAYTTTRGGGFSKPPFERFNLACHVGDVAKDVAKNRALLSEQLGAEPIWLEQTHSTNVMVIDGQNINSTAQTDGAITTLANTVCCVMTADCLPILLTDRQGSFVGALHAGWRGLANGIITEALRQIKGLRGGVDNDILAWLGPAIGPSAFEVGAEVKAAFEQKNGLNGRAFRRHGQKWLCDIYLLAKIELNGLGVTQIYGGEYCTFRAPTQFFSYRRDGVTGRMASCIFLR